MHWPALVHLLPFPTLPQEVFTHGCPWQSLSLAHVIEHWLVVAEHLNGAQVTGLVGLQLPSPSQTDIVTDICVVVLHVPDPQTVPLAYSWHAPLPSQYPFCMQVDMAAFWQAGRPVGAAWLAADAMQRPSKPARLHCQQLPTHADSQQTPSTQNPETQPDAAAQ